MSNVKYKTGIGFLLATLGRKTEYNWGQFLKRHDITTAEFTALSVISTNSGLTQKQLAEDIEVDPRNVVTTIKKLQNQGWVKAAADQKDGRAKNLSITDDGSRALGRMYKDLREIEAEFLQNISSGEIDQLQNLLLKLK